MRARKPSKRVVLVGQAPDRHLDLGTQLAHEGYAIDRVARLDAVLPLLGDGLHALIVGARTFAASDLLLLRLVRERSPRTAIVVVAQAPTDPDLKHALESGATAFLSWPSSPGALRQALDSVVPRGSQ